MFASESEEKLGTNQRLGPEGDERPVKVKNRDNRIPDRVRKRLHMNLTLEMPVECPSSRRSRFAEA